MRRTLKWVRVPEDRSCGCEDVWCTELYPWTGPRRRLRFVNLLEEQIAVRGSCRQTVALRLCGDFWACPLRKRSPDTHNRYKLTPRGTMERNGSLFRLVVGKCRPRRPVRPSVLLGRQYRQHAGLGPIAARLSSRASPLDRYIQGRVEQWTGFCNSDKNNISWDFATRQVIPRLSFGFSNTIQKNLKSNWKTENHDWFSITLEEF